MVTCALAGNVSREATETSGNIFRESMRHQRVPSGGTLRAVLQQERTAEPLARVGSSEPASLAGSSLPTPAPLGAPIHLCIDPPALPIECGRPPRGEVRDRWSIGTSTNFCGEDNWGHHSGPYMTTT